MSIVKEVENNIYHEHFNLIMPGYENKRYIITYEKNYKYPYCWMSKLGTYMTFNLNTEKGHVNSEKGYISIGYNECVKCDIKEYTIENYTDKKIEKEVHQKIMELLDIHKSMKDLTS